MNVSPQTFVSTAVFADQVNISKATAWRICQANNGFAVRIGGNYKIPFGHITRLMQGDSPAQIAAEVRNRGQQAA